MVTTLTVDQLLQLIDQLKNAKSDCDGDNKLSSLLSYLESYMDRVLLQNQGTLSQGKWYDSEAQLKTFLSLHNPSLKLLSNTEKNDIKAVMVSILVNKYEELNLNSRSGMSVDDLKAQFYGKEVFENIKNFASSWSELSLISYKMATMDFFLKEPNKLVMETAAVLLVKGQLICVSSGKPSQRVLRLHHIYHTVTDTVVLGRQVAEHRQSEQGDKYRKYLKDVRRTREDAASDHQHGSLPRKKLRKGLASNLKEKNLKEEVEEGVGMELGLKVDTEASLLVELWGNHQTDDEFALLPTEYGAPITRTEYSSASSEEGDNKNDEYCPGGQFTPAASASSSHHSTAEQQLLSSCDSLCGNITGSIQSKVKRGQAAPVNYAAATNAFDSNSYIERRDKL